MSFVMESCTIKRVILSPLSRVTARRRLSRSIQESPMKFFRLTFSLGLAALLLVSQSAFADDPNLYLIKARQGEMQVRAFSAAPLFDMAKGKVPYDADRAAALANNLLVLTRVDIGAAWAPGTGKDKYPGKTTAKPDIWDNLDEVQKHGQEYDAAVNELVKVAGGGLDALRSKIGDLGQACKGCHDDFREKE